ncbi:MAG: 16S rRNA (adenine(1518)-N(6)/adenine(1519)-N(6))-dimethyltransferase RsmA [Anaerolineales bacterium]
MNLPYLDIPRLLHQYRLHPDKSLGQNFLVDETALQNVIQAASVTSQDDVLEIGPGLGSLTRYLAIYAHTVIAVEVDPALIPVLNQVVGQFPNVRVIQGDILALDPVQLVTQTEYLVVANIPYYITSALIRHLLEASLPPKRLVLTIQQEVARRICAEPGDMNLLALSVQVYGHPQIMAYIPAGAFYPPPNVDSSIIRIDRYPSPLIPSDELEVFFQLIKAGFSQKRKTLRNALAGGLHLSPPAVEAVLMSALIDPMRRAESLSLSEWHLLTTVFSAQFSPK